MVVLMAGGLGKRLSPLTDSCPKPMLRIGGQPILESILKNCIDHGFHRFFIAVNHCAEQVEDYFGDGSQWKISIEYLREERLLGTAGALGLLPQLPSEPLVVMNGDVLTKINLDSLLKFHEEQTSDATMCIREYEYHVPFGVIALNGHEILRIEEKPVQRFFVNAGVYVLSPQAVQLVRPGQRIHMTELFEAAVNRSYSTAVFPVHEYWIDVGQHAQFEQAERDFRGAFRGD